METRIYSIRLMTELLGTVSKDQEVYSRFTESKKPVDKANENESETVDVLGEKGYTGFHKDENGLFIYEYVVKGMIKNAGNILKDVIGIKALRSKVNDFLYIAPRRIYLGAMEPHGIIERPIRVQTMQGPRVALIKSDYVKAGAFLTFDITLIQHKDLTFDVVDKLLKFGELQGLGQYRNGGYGRFEVIDVENK